MYVVCYPVFHTSQIVEHQYQQHVSQPARYDEGGDLDMVRQANLHGMMEV